MLKITAKELQALNKDIQQLEEAYDDGLGGYTVKFPMIYKIQSMLNYPQVKKGK
jgi:hypothetical protein